MTSKLSQLILEAGLAKYHDELLALESPSLRLFTNKIDEDKISIGRSKIGGRPDLPKGMEWPHFSNKYHYSFIGQINCDELSEYQLPYFPKEGMLYFFYAVDAVFEVFINFDVKENTKVIYIPRSSLSELKRVEFPPRLDVKWRYEACSVDFQYEKTLPPGESSNIEKLGMSFYKNKEDFFIYSTRILAEYYKEQTKLDPCINRLLGFPDQMQGDLQRQAYAIWREQDQDNLQYQDIVELASEWRLLLQVDSEVDKTGMMWGDNGKIYFIIRLKDLAKKRFDNCVAVFQW